MADLNPYLLYGLAWLSFGLLHSILAREGAKTVLKPAFGAFYRLSYNILAVLHLGAIYIFGQALFEGSAPFIRPNWLWWCQGTLNGLGWIMMFWALKAYDLGRLAGTQQVREYFQGAKASDEEPLHFNGFHRWMRHPLYAAGFMILWGRITSEFDLYTAILGSLYLLIGTYYEERHLMRLYGQDYTTYQSQVPAYVPYKGRVEYKEEQ